MSAREQEFLEYVQEGGLVETAERLNTEYSEERLGKIAFNGGVE